MSIAIATLLAAALTAAAATASTLWAKRRGGPDAHLATITASTMLMAQLQTRLASQDARIALLEERVAHLEEENTAYHRLYGPLP